ncbi:hypothetical protein PBY51_000043 [Eleginops maclovinus]|uniref:Uncharacterized protein n=1 Tax=Eleginops maclovinus TaxID=56733 RepID=A0AAN8ANS2_ELEMC|nr:hypothetical protein PBY51_000043 [Eleginops maclovinus]
MEWAQTADRTLGAGVESMDAGTGAGSLENHRGRGLEHGIRGWAWKFGCGCSRFKAGVQSIGGSNKVP